MSVWRRNSQIVHKIFPTTMNLLLLVYNSIWLHVHPDLVWLWTNGTGVRQREWGELHYSLLLARKNMYNAGRFIVAHSGAPPQPALPWVEYISENNFIPLQWQNGSNSVLVEWHLDRLMRLAETTDPIVTFNDDFFVTKPVDASRFAYKTVWCQETWGGEWGYGNEHRSYSAFTGSVEAANRAFRRMYADFKPTNIIAHVPYVVRLTTLDFVWNYMNVGTTLSLKREIYNLQFQYTLAAAEARNGTASYGQCSQVQIRADLPLLALEHKLRRKIWPTFINLNDDFGDALLKPSTVTTIRHTYTRFFKRLLSINDATAR